MNVVDIVLVVAAVIAAVRGFRHGAMSQVAAFGGAAAGLLLGATFAPRVARWFVSEPGPLLSLSTLAALLAFVLVGQAVGVWIGEWLRRAVHGIGAGPLDRTAGVVVGMAGLLVTVWLLSAALVQGPSAAVAQQVQRSRIVAALDTTLPPPPDVFARVGTYLDRHGFPQVFAGLGGGSVAPPVDPPSEGAVAAATAAGQPGTVQVQAAGCGGISSGTGFVTAWGYVVTNAHVIAGGDSVVVIDREGEHEATPIHMDPVLDLAVLAAPTASATPLPWTSTPADRGTEGATLGFPGGQREMEVKAAAVRGRGEAVGRDIYGRGTALREILTLSSPVERGDSGGPFVTSDGSVAGVVFASAASQPGTGYALTAERVRPDVEAAIARATEVDTGA